jgi:hypothetical protein
MMIEIAQSVFSSTLHRRIRVLAILVLPKRSGSSGVLFLVPLLLMAGEGRCAADQKPDVAAAFAAIRENGERLRSGIYNATGTLEQVPSGLARDPDSPTDVIPAKINETIEGAFDHVQGKLHQSRIRLQFAGSQPVKFGKWTKSWLILRPERSIQARMNDPDGIANAAIKAPITAKEAPGYFRPVFDTRILCLTGVKGLNKSFEDLIDDFETTEFEIIDDGLDIIHLRADVPIPETNGGGERFEIWIDPQQGHQPIRYMVTQGPLSGLGEISKPVTKSETSWTEINGVWVPETVLLYSRSPEWGQQFHIAFTWQSVNEPVPESWFTWEGLDLPDRSQVADRSVVDDVIIPVAIVGKSLEREVARPLQESARPENSRAIWWLILANVIIVGVAIGWILRRRVRTKP